MTSLSLIETEAHQLVRRLPESRRLAQQAALVERTTGSGLANPGTVYVFRMPRMQEINIQLYCPQNAHKPDK